MMASTTGSLAPQNAYSLCSCSFLCPRFKVKLINRKDEFHRSPGKSDLHSFSDIRGNLAKSAFNQFVGHREHPKHYRKNEDWKARKGKAKQLDKGNKAGKGKE